MHNPPHHFLCPLLYGSQKKCCVLSSMTSTCCCLMCILLLLLAKIRCIVRHRTKITIPADVSVPFPTRNTIDQRACNKQ